jgi:flagellar biosynthesis protein FliQ
MSQALVIDLARNAVMLALMVGGPLMLVALVIGLAVSVFQAVTQIQEQTLSFVPKLIAVSVAFLITLPWMLEMMIRYTTDLFRSIPTIAS